MVRAFLIIILSTGWLASARGGPFAAALDDPANPHDAPIPGFTGPHGVGKPRIMVGPGEWLNPGNRVTPLFFAWADGAPAYQPSSGVSYADAGTATGPVTGDIFDVVSLGELDEAALAASTPPGTITLTLPMPLRNLPGADFAVFENALQAGYGGFPSNGSVFAELAYVEVSSDGEQFARFPATCLVSTSVGAYASLDPTQILGLAGKHANNDEQCWGTPFDLEALASVSAVVNGHVDLDAVTHVRVVDIPGSGDFKDASGNPIYDAWPTVGSAGFDLEAVGAISVSPGFEGWQDIKGLAGTERGLIADGEKDRLPNLIEYLLGLDPLCWDPEGAPHPLPDDGSGPGITFTRDTRATDVTCEVEHAPTPDGPWSVVARSNAGGDLLAVAPFAPAIADVSASSIRSVGVIRRHTVRLPADSRGFFRVRAELTPSP